MVRALFFAVLGLLSATNSFAEPKIGLPTFYSARGREREVSFEGTFRSHFTKAEQLSALSHEQKLVFARNQMDSTLQFLFGPLVNRGLASPQRGSRVEVDWASAFEQGGQVHLRYSYRAMWILSKDVPEEFTLPVPFQKDDLQTRSWKNCTDSDPEHQTASFYWYFWDPERPGCDHQEGREYQTVTVRLGLPTINQKLSYPEYDKLLRAKGVENRFQLTFAFGYVEEQADPDPFQDYDQGAQAYRIFLESARRLTGRAFRDEPVLQGEYRGSSSPQKEIGRRLIGKLRGVDVEITIVMAAGIDQMELFAESFAHRHDTFFGWFGHSRVGSGFDAETFWRKVVRNPQYYSVVPDYQLIYWAGCNSYSYYTLPFFEFKAHVANGRDPYGTKGLDIIANGLPSYFSLNDDNALIVLRRLLAWNERASYQTIVNELEARAGQSGAEVLVAVLGDEDNAENDR